MISRQRTVDAARDEILAAIDELRTVSMADRDEQRRHVAEQLHALFVGITEKRALREAARGALGLYRGGMGSFQDVGYPDMIHAVDRLRLALRRGRSRFL